MARTYLCEAGHISEGQKLARLKLESLATIGKTDINLQATKLHVFIVTTKRGWLPPP